MGLVASKIRAASMACVVANAPTGAGTSGGLRAFVLERIAPSQRSPAAAQTVLVRTSRQQTAIAPVEHRRAPGVIAQRPIVRLIPTARPAVSRTARAKTCGPSGVAGTAGRPTATTPVRRSSARCRSSLFGKRTPTDLGVESRNLSPMGTRPRGCPHRRGYLAAPIGKVGRADRPGCLQLYLMRRFHGFALVQAERGIDPCPIIILQPPAG